MAGCVPAGEGRLIAVLSLCFWSGPALWRILQVDYVWVLNCPPDCKISIRTGGGSNRNN